MAGQIAIIAWIYREDSDSLVRYTYLSVIIVKSAMSDGQGVVML